MNSFISSKFTKEETPSHEEFLIFLDSEIEYIRNNLLQSGSMGDCEFTPLTQTLTSAQVSEV
jgi:hypothetical protein